MDEIRIVVVDDHPLFRQGIIDAISLEEDIVVVGQADNGDDALSIIIEMRPKVAILDVNLPGINGMHLTKKVASKNIPTKVILITAYDDKEQIIHAMRYGASAYQSKEIKPDELIKTIRDVAAGWYVVEGNILNKFELELWLQNRVVETNRVFSDSSEPFRPLSNREMEVLSYLTRGMSNKEIANLLDISHQTVKNHVTSILRKIGVDDRTQAAVYALRRGWFRLYDRESNP
jgi:DNA-binding NarL/FixJ family response regulator